MDGDIGGAFAIKPDQMQVVNPVLIIVFIPLFDAFVYPLLARIGLKRPLQKLTVGMILVAVSFAMSAFLELKLESLDPIVPKIGEAQLRVFNGMPYGGDWVLNTKHEVLHEIRVPSMGLVEIKHVPLRHAEAIQYTASETQSRDAILHGVFNLKPAQADSFFITNRQQRVQIVEYLDAPGKPSQDQPMLRVLFTAMSSSVATNRTILLRSHTTGLERKIASDSLALQALGAGQYAVYVDGQLVDDGLSIYTGGVYTYLLSEQSYGKYVSLTVFSKSYIQCFLMCFASFTDIHSAHHRRTKHHSHVVAIAAIFRCHRSGDHVLRNRTGVLVHRGAGYNEISAASVLAIDRYGWEHNCCHCGAFTFL